MLTMDPKFGSARDPTLTKDRADVEVKSDEVEDKSHRGKR